MWKRTPGINLMDLFSRLPTSLLVRTIEIPTPYLQGSSEGSGFIQSSPKISNEGAIVKLNLF